MEVPLNPDVQSKLTQIAAARGRAVESVAREAIERFVNYDDWFTHEVGKGIAAADRGDLIEHEDVRQQIDGWFPI